MCMVSHLKQTERGYVSITYRWIEIACDDVLDSSSVSACHSCIKGFTRKICFFSNLAISLHMLFYSSPYKLLNSNAYSFFFSFAKAMFILSFSLLRPLNNHGFHVEEGKTIILTLSQFNSLLENNYRK